MARFKGIIGWSLAVLFLSLTISADAGAQYRTPDRDRDRDTQAAPKTKEQKTDGDKKSRGTRRDRRDSKHDDNRPRSKAQSRSKRDGDRRREDTDRDRRRRADSDKDRQRTKSDRDRRRRADRREDRRRYDRRGERRWHDDRDRRRGRVTVPHRWEHRKRPRHRHLWKRRYGRVWWCGRDCDILLLFGFTVWAVDIALSYESAYSFPIWEALEYNRTGETSLWESSWGYVEFTPTRTFRRRFGRHMRDCRDFLRVVVPDRGRERHYRGTACRNPQGVWWVVSSREVFR